MPNSKIVALGACRGENDVPNADIIEAIDSSDEWIRQRTGIITRKRAGAQTTIIDMATAAAKQALDSAGLAPDQIDLILVATITHFTHTPSAAAEIGYRLGVGQAAVLDINAACAGYTYAIFQADLMIKSGMFKHALVIGAEKLSEFIDPADRSISFLLADGAGAAVLTASETAGVLQTVCGGDTSQVKAVGLNGSTNQIRAEQEWPTLRQEGPSVFRWAVWQMAKVAKQILEVNSLQAEQLGAFVPHQANIRIIDELAKQIGLGGDVLIADDIRTTGNSSSASIPMAMHSLLENHSSLSGKLALQIGFGAGLTYAGQVVVMP